MGRFVKIDEVSAPNGVISGLTYSIVGSVVTIAPGSWRINNIIYSKAIDTNFTLSASDLINSRFDLIRANATDIYLDEGVTSQIAVKPTLPADNVEVKLISVTPSGISTAGGSLAGYVTNETFNATIGDKTELATDNKNDMVQAVNELEGDISGLQSDNITLAIFKVSNYATL